MTFPNIQLKFKCLVTSNVLTSQYSCQICLSFVNTILRFVSRIKKKNPMIVMKIDTADLKIIYGYLEKDNHNITQIRLSSHKLNYRV